MAKYTPMIEQYLKVKEQAQDAFLFSVWAISMKCFLMMRFWLPRSWKLR